MLLPAITFNLRAGQSNERMKVVFSKLKTDNIILYSLGVGSSLRKEYSIFQFFRVLSDLIKIFLEDFWFDKWFFHPLFISHPISLELCTRRILFFEVGVLQCRDDYSSKKLLIWWDANMGKMFSPVFGTETRIYRAFHVFLGELLRWVNEHHIHGDRRMCCKKTEDIKKASM